MTANLNTCWHEPDHVGECACTPDCGCCQVTPSPRVPWAAVDLLRSAATPDGPSKTGGFDDSIETPELDPDLVEPDHPQQPSLRERAIDALGQALNRAGYWLPVDGRPVAVDAVLALTAADLDAAQRRAVHIQGLLDEQRERARKDAIAGRESERILQAQIDAQAREIDRLRDGLAALHEGEEQPVDEHVVPSPAQWLWQWNHATPEQRLDMAGQIISASETASRCHLDGHAYRIADGRASQAAIGRVRAEVDRWLLNTLEPQTARALSNVMRALEQPKETP
ncbi:hypothetical protein ACFXJO_05705 [Streptomyces lavendulae]|uniref:hypothetical protein n=1 Tax=Streptomyces lavendulae TaxID=1914 RepID=UPI003696FE17